MNTNTVTRKVVKRPMLAAPVKWVGDSLDLSRFPEGNYLLSPKIDGIRCLIQPGKGAVSRKLLDIPNHYIREVLWEKDKTDLEGFDGELVVPNWVAEKMGKTIFNATQSIVMSAQHEYEKEVYYMVFDDFSDPYAPYRERYTRSHKRVAEITKGSHDIGGMLLHTTMQTYIHMPQGSGAVESQLRYWVGQGYEGVVMRLESCAYKYGRATLLEGGMSKIKPPTASDEEGVVVGYQELYVNENELQTDELGYAKRSTAKDHKVPGGTLGALIIETEKWGKLRVGSGFDAALRQSIWDYREAWLGKTITFCYQETPGAVKPRFPIFKGERRD